MEFPKELKFPKNPTSDHDLCLESGYVSNGHWIVKADWILGIASTKEKKKLGLAPLAKLIADERIKLVNERIQGRERRTRGLESLLSKLEIAKQYREVSRELVKFHTGFPTGNFAKPGKVYLTFVKNAKKSPAIDMRYGALLFFDLTTRAFISNPMSPLVLTDSMNQIVAVIAPLNPERLKEESQ